MKPEHFEVLEDHAVFRPTGQVQKFGVTVAGNAGLTGEVFESEEEARARLTKSS
jgi:hypothetical protein